MTAYDAFISYGQDADAELAEALQTGLQRLAKPRSVRMEIHSDRAAILDDREHVVSPQLPVQEAVVGRETVLTSHTTRFEPASVVAAVVAVVLLLIGGITAVRAGVDGSLDKPVVTVANYTATALLGLIEIAFGLVLLAAACRGRVRRCCFSAASVACSR